MKLLLADDHTLFRDALVQYIERADPDAEVTLAKDLDEAMACMAEDSNQDLILLDLKMPGMNGLRGLEAMREAYPDVPVALMSGMAESKDVQDAIKLGAVGYFPKTMSGKALLKGIQCVLSGQKFVPIDEDTHVVMPSHYTDGETSQTVQGFEVVNENQLSKEDVKLTPRENDVLQFLALGQSNKEIARALGLQVVTIKLHVRGICRKLNVKNRTQAAIRAHELGLVS